jgi:hypothetical protein
MNGRENILVAIVAVLVIVILFVLYSDRKTHSKSNFFSDDPYAIIEHQNAAKRGVRHDAQGQPSYLQKMQLSDYYATGADLMPQDVDKAEQQAWFRAIPPGGAKAHYNTEEGFYAGSDMTQSHTPGYDMDYDGTYLTDLVINPRMRANHNAWVEEMKPWSGVSKKVDTLEVENYLPRVGITAFRMSAPPQYNPLQLTEVDQNDFLRGGKPFRFQG